MYNASSGESTRRNEAEPEKSQPRAGWHGHCRQSSGESDQATSEQRPGLPPTGRVQNATVLGNNKVPGGWTQPSPARREKTALRGSQGPDAM